MIHENSETLALDHALDQYIMHSLHIQFRISLKRGGVHEDSSRAGSIVMHAVVIKYGLVDLETSQLWCTNNEHSIVLPQWSQLRHR